LYLQANSSAIVHRIPAVSLALDMYKCTHAYRQISLAISLSILYPRAVLVNRSVLNPKTFEGFETLIEAAPSVTCICVTDRCRELLTTSVAWCSTAAMAGCEVQSTTRHYVRTQQQPGNDSEICDCITIKSYQYVFPRGCIHVHAKSAICEQLVIKTFHITADCYNAISQSRLFLLFTRYSFFFYSYICWSTGL